MATRKLDETEWKAYMDRVSKHLPTTRVEMHVDGLDIGDQLEADRLPLMGLSYEPASNTLQVLGEGLQHSISGPQEIWVQEEAGSLKSLEVLDSDGHKQIIRLDRALALPAA
jgi:hypothetical protein